MDYETASDKSISLEIFELKYGKLGSDKDMLRIWNSGKIDYCNNPADMCPIILSNKISLMWDWSELGKCSAIGKSWEIRQLGVHFINHEFTHKNPLRAAAIVFLKMQEV